MGRPTKGTTDAELDRLPSFPPQVIDKARKILKTSLSKFPGRHRLRIGLKLDATLALVLEFFGMPDAFDPTRKTGTERALKFAKLFADEPAAMIDALPKILKLMQNIEGNSRHQVYGHFVDQRILRRAGISKGFDNDRPANVLAPELSKKFSNSGITARTIDHVRADIRTFARKK